MSGVSERTQGPSGWSRQIRLSQLDWDARLAGWAGAGWGAGSILQGRGEGPADRACLEGILPCLQAVEGCKSYSQQAVSPVAAARVLVCCSRVVVQFPWIAQHSNLLPMC